MKQIVRTRIAPSPTGEDLHIGSVYMAIFNYAFAKKYQGSFVVRIEDTDRERYVKGAEEKMLTSLNWMGITHDEGVDIGGNYGPYRQSERLPTYKHHALQLVDQGDAYYCFCTSERLKMMRQRQQKNGQPPMYDGHCKTIPQKEAQELAKTKPYVIRLNVPDTGETVFTDLVRGEIRFQNNLIDDQILLKTDGYPTYHLAVVVDDHLMQISHVIRGEEWISSTPKHILLYQMFKWNLPFYAHLPLLRNPDKSKISKRKNPVWTSWFKKQGFLPEAIINYLGTLTWGMNGKDMFTLQDMVKHFDFTQIKTTAPIFDMIKLTWLNGEYIRAMKDQELVKRLEEYIPKVDKKLIKQLVPLAKERMKTLKEFEIYIKPFTNYAPFKLNKQEKEILAEFVDVYHQVNKWNFKELHLVSKKIVNKNKLSLRDAFMTVRLAVTGEKVGLPLFETMEILGKEEVFLRINKHL